MREREPLHNFEAEQAVLGAVLADNGAWHQLADFLRPEAFADPLHGRLWQGIGRMIGRGQNASPVSLQAFAQRDADMLKAGGAGYLVKLANASVHAVDAVDMGRIVHELHLRRQAIEAAQAVIDGAHDGDAALNPMAGIAEAAARLGDLADSAAPDATCKPFGAVVERVLGTADAIYKRGGGLSGMSTGYPTLDGMLGGLHPGELTILAARPAMGKSALALGIGANVAGAGTPAGFFSLEMSAEQLGARLVSEVAGVPGHKIRQGTMSAAEIERYMRAGDARKSLPLFIDDAGSLTIAALRARAARMKRTHGVGLVIVDYLQLLSGADRRDGRTQEVSEITRGLKALAKELHCPVLALSQLSRAVEQRTDKRPMLSDLRESGSIEQDADAVAFIYREEYYAERSDRAGSPDHIAAMGQAEIIVAKQRHGPTGTVRLRFDGALVRFSDIASTTTAREAA
jgi:replicative DNA helicase